MSESSQVRKERAESRIEALLAGMDETVRELYRSLLDNSADYRDLSEEKQAARLEGFHDYIIVREETGVEHPSLAEFIAVRKKFGGELLSFGAGRHRVEVAGNEADAPQAEEAEEDHWDAPAEEAVVEEPAEEPAVEEDEPTVEEPAVEAEEEVTELEEAVEASVEEHETRSILDDDDEEEVIIDGNADDEPVAESFDKVIAEHAEPVEEKPEVPGRLNDQAILDKEFSTKLGGYNIDDVDDLLDDVAAFLKGQHSKEEFIAKAEEIRNPEFRKASFRKGFTVPEVDGFLSGVVAELETRATEV